MTKARKRAVRTPAAPVAVPVVTPPSRQPAHLVAVAVPSAPSLPGGRATRADRPPVPPPLTAEEQVLWNRVLRNTREGQAQYRTVPDGADASTLGVCADCDVDCCTSHVVPINVADVARLSSVLNLRPREFVALTPWVEAYPVHPVAWGRERRALALRRREDHSCAFLIRFGDFRRCGVHSLRPDACRMFPFVLDGAAQRAQPANRLLQLHPSHCPWRWPESAERKAQLLADLAENTRHRDVDRDVLSGWNGPADVDAFYAFLDGALAQLTAS